MTREPLLPQEAPALLGNEEDDDYDMHRPNCFGFRVSSKGSAMALAAFSLVVATLCVMAVALTMALLRTVPKQTGNPTTVLISIDGFRWDYLQWGHTPHLNALAARGIRMQSLVPCYPTVTFPNHYSIVTGLYVEEHGIVQNTMFDPTFNATFSLSNNASMDGRWWSEGEPIWVSAAKESKITATYFWPGSDAEIRGYRPTYWHPFNSSVPGAERMQAVQDWISLPPTERPSFIASYFDVVDHAGHSVGANPNSTLLIEALEEVDGHIGALVAFLETRPANSGDVDIIVVSDHGMSPPSSPLRVLFIDDYVDLTRVRLLSTDPQATMIPQPGFEDEVLANLTGVHPALNASFKQSLPARFHYSNNSRITLVVAWVQLGWRFTTHATYNWNKDYYDNGGAHGYDNEYTEMHGIFMAAGPNILDTGAVLPPMENVHIYNVLAKLLALQHPAPNSGSSALADLVLKSS